MLDIILLYDIFIIVKRKIYGAIMPYTLVYGADGIHKSCEEATRFFFLVRMNFYSENLAKSLKHDNKHTEIKYKR